MKLRKQDQERQSLKNSKLQAGMSLVEVLVGMGLLGGLSVGFMNYQTNLLKTEFNNKVRQEIGKLENDLETIFSEKKTCELNLSEAFIKTPIMVGENAITSAQTFTKVLGEKKFLSGGMVEQKVIFDVNQGFENGRIVVGGVSYSLKNVKSYDVSAGGAWTHTGELQLEVSFEKCAKQGAILKGSEVVCPKDNRIAKKKTLTKSVNFNMTAGNQIKELSVSRGPAGSPPETILDISCRGKSELNEQEKLSCMIDAKLQASAGKDGPTPDPCNYLVVLNSVKKPLMNKGGRYYYKMPTGFAPNSLKVTILGGGGGGGGGGPAEAGTGGQAGSAITNITLPESVAGKVCEFIVGFGGLGGNEKESGRHGTMTSISCGGDIFFSAQGGMGGRARALESTPGEMGQSSIYGRGGEGRPGNADPGVNGSGGGAGGKDGDGGKGGKGGDGVIAVSWTTQKIFDQTGETLLSPEPTDWEVAPPPPSKPLPGGDPCSGGQERMEGGSIDGGVSQPINQETLIQPC